MPQIVIEEVTPDHAEIIRLVEEQEVEVMARYATDDRGPGLTAGTPCLLARVDGVALGCVAVAPLHSGVGEIKRLYVSPEARGLGLSRRLMAEADALAVRLGHGTLRLETGTKQPEAVRLYETSGWTVIPNYGHYRDDPEVISMEKAVVPDRQGGLHEAPEASKLKP